MSKNIVKPRSVSFEDALRNLASRLTGRPAADLPRTQEGVVQYMAENVPSLDEMAEAVTQEVMARMVESGGAVLAAAEPTGEPQDSAEEAGVYISPPGAEISQEATEGTAKPKVARNTKAKAEK